MLNTASIEAVRGQAFGPGLIRPAYGSYCFAHIPDTVRHCFGLGREAPLPKDCLPTWRSYRKVILILVDAFGWAAYQRFAEDDPFLREMAAGGVVSQLTSMFPSTTAAHITCLHTGQPVAVSGVHEWYYYEPLADMVITSLPFMPAGDRQPDQLLKMGFRPELIFPGPTIYQGLAAAGIQSVVLQHQSYARSAYSTVITHGARMVSYETCAEALVNLQLAVESAKGPFYAVFYYGSVDAMGHRYGPFASQTDAETEATLGQLSRFLRGLHGRSPDTLLLLTADHGHARIDPATTVYINQVLPGLRSLLRTNRRGEPLLFGGSPRDLFLYVRDEHLDQVQADLSGALAGRAAVWRTSEMVDGGLFGPPPISDRLRARLGNLVVLPYDEESVSWYEQGRFEQRYYGQHGGLSSVEMTIPFMAYEL